MKEGERCVASIQLVFALSEQPVRPSPPPVRLSVFSALVIVSGAVVVVVGRLKPEKNCRDTQKAPTCHANCRGFVTASSKFFGLRVGPRTVAQMGVHKIYTGSGLRRVIPYVQFELLCYLRGFVVGVTNG
jgi:hypothetical protein